MRFMIFKKVWYIGIEQRSVTVWNFNNYERLSYIHPGIKSRDKLQREVGLKSAFVTLFLLYLHVSAIKKKEKESQMHYLFNILRLLCVQVCVSSTLVLICLLSFTNVYISFDTVHCLMF